MNILRKIIFNIFATLMATTLISAKEECRMMMEHDTLKDKSIKNHGIKWNYLTSNEASVD